MGQWHKSLPFHGTKLLVSGLMVESCKMSDIAVNMCGSQQCAAAAHAGNKAGVAQ